MKKIMVGLVLVASLLNFGCTRVETGHVGIRVTFNGTVEPQELPVGFHQIIIGNVRHYVSNEMTMFLTDLRPQTKDRTNLNDLDLTYTYSIAPGSIAELIVKYKGRDAVMDDQSELYPLGLYVQNIMTTSASDIVAKYDALSANENREKIKDEIRNRAQQLFAEEKLDTIVRIHQVFIKNLEIDPALMASARTVITAQNELKAKDYEVQTARKESERQTLLSSNSKNLEYMRVQAQLTIAQAVLAGKVNTIIIPQDFKGIVDARVRASE